MASSDFTQQFDTFLDEKYIPLDKGIKIGIVAGTMCLMVACYYFFFYAPGAAGIANIKQQIHSAQLDLNKAKKAARDLPEYRAKIKKTQKAFKTAAIVLPKTKEIPNLLRNISDLGKGAGLDFLSFKPGGETARDFYAEIPVNISIRGPYHNMGFFLDQVSKLDRIVTVNNIKMGSPKKIGGEMLLSSTCRLMTYRFTNAQVVHSKKKK